MDEAFVPGVHLVHGMIQDCISNTMSALILLVFTHAISILVDQNTPMFMDKIISGEVVLVILHRCKDGIGNIMNILCHLK